MKTAIVYLLPIILCFGSFFLIPDSYFNRLGLGAAIGPCNYGIVFVIFHVYLDKGLSGKGWGLK